MHDRHLNLTYTPACSMKTSSSFVSRLTPKNARRKRTCFLATIVISFVLLVALFKKITYEETFPFTIHLNVIAISSKEGAVQQEHTNSKQYDEIFENDNVVILGEIDHSKPHAVFSTTTDTEESIDFIFYLPLTTLAWKRIGFESVIIIVGSVDIWNSNELFRLVLSNVRQLGAVVVFLKSYPYNSVMASEVSRIFAANYLQSRDSLTSHQRAMIDEIYLITTESDLWPFDNDIYRLPKNKDIFSPNSDCCRRFSHRGSSYNLLPMASVGMKMRTWIKLTQRFARSPSSYAEILQLLVSEVDDFERNPHQSGANDGGFLGEKMLSLLVARSIKENETSAAFIPRNTRKDRIDRTSLNAEQGIRNRVDARLFTKAYAPSVWSQLVPLVRAMYGNDSERYRWCVQYYENFQRIFVLQKVDAMVGAELQ